MITVKQILDEKGREVWTIVPDATVFDALKLMAEKGIGALVVIENSQVAGIISERDYARKITLMGRFSKDTLVKDIMTTQVYGVHPSATAEECLALMTDRRIRHLPVLEKDKLAGVISIGDVVKAVMSTQKVTIQQLENYIMGKYQ
jgi:CBS domain-containing protein